MMFKNSIKLLMANFSTVWKLLVYKLIALGITVGLFFIGYSSISGMSSFVTLKTSTLDFVMTFNIGTSLGEVLRNLLALIDVFFAFIADIAVTNTGMLVYFAIVFLIILPFLWKLSDIPTGETLYGYMASLTKYSFTGSMIRKIGISSRYSLLSLAIFLPINFLIAYGLYGILTLVNMGGIMLAIVPLLIFVYLSLIIGLKTALFCGWMPAIVVFNCGPVKGLKLGFKAVFRRFLKVLSTAIMLTAFVLAINLLFGSFSFIITIPIGAMMVLVFQMVMFFGSQGMRYYVDLDTILSPKKLEQTDKFNKVKDII